MPYPAPFHRVVLTGTLYSDTFATTLAMIPNGGGTLPPVSTSLVDAVGAAVADWFNNPMTDPSPTGVGIINQCKLVSVKVNRIGTDGRYQDADAKEHVPSTPVAGSNSGVFAPQLSAALTLRGSNERARAGRGRMYLPPSEVLSYIGADGRVSAAKALSHAKGGLYLLGMLNDVYSVAGVSAVAGISSNTGAGAFQAVHHVSVGRVVDTIRSRRNKLDEDPQIWGTP